MLVPLSWLRDFAPFDLDPAALGEVFDDLGMVVEEITQVGAGLEEVVVARVRSVDAIPGADKIRRVSVDRGSAEAVQVVCGAWNFDVGDLVALAPVGAVLPGGFAISRRRMKGVVSDGMLCSARELGLGDDAAGLLLLTGRTASPGTPIADALGLRPDVVYDLAIEANRPDANCVAGVARDAAARLGTPFAIREPPAIAGTGTPAFTLAASSPDLCDRFTATVFEGIAVGPSPEWVAARLTAAGMRPISNVVDASNYVMLELGQPTHAYDLDRLPSPGLGVRAARPGERLVTLDGVDRQLGIGAHPDAVICDGDDTAIGIAGIMGGASSEVHEGTTRVALEAAHFVPMAIARSSKRLGLRSEASARFERGVDIEGIDRAVARFAQILGETCPRLVARGPTVDWRASEGGRAPIPVRVGRANALLGTALSADQIRSLLSPIGFAVGAADGDGVLAVTPPSFRPDVTAEVDVAEEIARHHGYARIPRTSVRPTQVGALTPYQRQRRVVREVLTGAGLSEAAGTPLLAPGDHPRAGLAESDIVAADPLVKEESVLRASLLPGLLRAVAFNQDRRNSDLGLFEIGDVWAPSAHAGTVAGPDMAPGHGLPVEREVVAVALAGAGPAGWGADARAAVRVVRRLAAALRVERLSLSAGTAPGLHPTRTAEVLVAGLPVGWVGEVDPEVGAAWGIEGRVGWMELDLRAFLTAPRAPEGARPVSKYPSSDLDLAFVVGAAEPAGAVEATLAGAAGDLLEWVRLFDVYRGPGVPSSARSLAFRLRFVALDHTLTDAELAERRESCIRAVETAHAATLRR